MTTRHIPFWALPFYVMYWMFFLAIYCTVFLIGLVIKGLWEFLCWLASVAEPRVAAGMEGDEVE